MNKLAILTLLASACATGHTLVAERDSAPTGHVKLEFTAPADTQAVFPSALDPQLPSVDRIGRAERGTLGERAAAMIDLCVSPAGAVTKASLVESSSFSEFDAALLKDINTWQFSRMPGPASVQSCERAKVTYRPY